MTGRKAIAACALLLAAASAVHAQPAVTRVDDSGTVVSQPVVPMKWRHLVPGRAGDNTVEAQVRVALRLDLARFVNQPIRLFMVLAPGTSASVQARWRTQGRLLPGSVRSAGRALVFEGPVPSAVLEETIELTLEADGRDLVAAENLHFYFEAER